MDWGPWPVEDEEPWPDWNEEAEKSEEEAVKEVGAAKGQKKRRAKTDEWPPWGSTDDPAPGPSKKLCAKSTPQTSKPSMKTSKTSKKKNKISLEFHGGSLGSVLSELPGQKTKDSAFSRKGQDAEVIKQRLLSGDCSCSSHQRACHREVSESKLLATSRHYWGLEPATQGHLLRMLKMSCREGTETQFSQFRC
jgi:hypothetical protein